VIVLAWGYFLYAGSIETIWPMFGIANQLLATVGLAIATIVLVNLGRTRYIWVTVCPMAFVAVTTVTAGILSIRDNFWPMTSSPEPAVRMQGFTNSTLTVIMLVCVATILVAAGRRWLQARNGVMLAKVASDEA
jgi:carbon starvation protein